MCNDNICLYMKFWHGHAFHYMIILDASTCMPICCHLDIMGYELKVCHLVRRVCVSDMRYIFT